MTYETPEGRHLRVAVLADILKLDEPAAEVILLMAERAIMPDHPIIARVVFGGCGASLTIGNDDPFFCQLPAGHRVEHDWAWMLRK